MRRGPAQQCSQSCQEHDEGKWFGQKIVGPQIKSVSLVVLPVLCREHQNRRHGPVCADRATDVIAVHSGKHDVEDEHIEFVLPRHPETIEPVRRDLGHEALGGKPPGHGVRYRRLIFDKKHFHPHPPLVHVRRVDHQYPART